MELEEEESVSGCPREIDNETPEEYFQRLKEEGFIKIYSQAPSTQGVSLLFSYVNGSDAFHNIGVVGVFDTIPVSGLPLDMAMRSPSSCTSRCRRTGLDLSPSRTLLAEIPPRKSRAMGFPRSNSRGLLFDFSCSIPTRGIRIISQG